MDKKEQYKIEKQIDFLLEQIDLDKFHYSRSVYNFIAKITILITIFISLISIINSYEELSLLIIFKSALIIILVIVVIIFVLKIKDSYDGQIGGYKKDVEARNKLVKTAYKRLGVDTDKLDYEFEKYGGSIR
ncbi:MAG: hypothetical protein AABX28_02000 [Nanoarchaeota archaeon]